MSDAWLDTLEEAYASYPYRKFEPTGREHWDDTMTIAHLEQALKALDMNAGHYWHCDRDEGLARVKEIVTRVPDPHTHTTLLYEGKRRFTLLEPPVPLARFVALHSHTKSELARFWLDELYPLPLLPPIWQELEDKGLTYGFDRGVDDPHTYQPMINLNDYFYYACVDCMPFPQEELPLLRHAYETHGEEGVNALCSLKRAALPLTRYRTPEFLDAHAYLSAYLKANNITVTPDL